MPTAAMRRRAMRRLGVIRRTPPAVVPDRAPSRRRSTEPPRITGSTSPPETSRRRSRALPAPVASSGRGHVQAAPCRPEPLTRRSPLAVTPPTGPCDRGNPWPRVDRPSPRSPSCPAAPSRRSWPLCGPTDSQGRMDQPKEELMPVRVNARLTSRRVSRCTIEALPATSLAATLRADGFARSRGPAEPGVNGSRVGARSVPRRRAATRNVARRGWLDRARGCRAGQPRGDRGHDGAVGAAELGVGLGRAAPAWGAWRWRAS
jgi:hypothetical protein